MRLSDAHRAPLVVTVPKLWNAPPKFRLAATRLRPAPVVGRLAYGSCRMLLIADKPGGTPTSQKSQTYLTVRQSQTTHVVVGCVGE